MKRLVVALLGIVLAAVAIGWLSLSKDQRALIATAPTDRDVLFWSVAQRDAAFRALDQFPILAKSRVIAAGSNPFPLPNGKQLDIAFDMAAFEAEQRSAAIVIVLDGKVVYESYGLDFGPEGKWTSFSVAKSLTSTLVGAAMQDGAIKSLDDPITAYISDLQGSAYDGVTIRQVLTMSSGVDWTEDYFDPASDVALFNEYSAADGEDATIGYMRRLGRAEPAGSAWHYNTGETNLIGVLVSEATGTPLADYLSQKIWQPFGMEQDASWLLNSTGREMGGCCIQATTRDMARFGLFVLGDGIAGGRRIVPQGWFDQATTTVFDTDRAERGYAYQWWTYDDGSFAAGGIFGQGIFIDPTRNLVIASNANWPLATDDAGVMAQRHKFYDAVQASVDEAKNLSGE